MGGRGSNGVARLLTGPNKTTQWKREQITISGVDITGQSNGAFVVFKTGGGMYQIYDKAKQREVTQGHGVDLKFDKMKDAKQHAITLATRSRATNKIATVKQLQKDLTAAKADATRKLRKYRTAAGAVTGFDWHGQTPNTNDPRYKKLVADRDKAKADYLAAVKKRGNLQKKLNKYTPKAQKNAPF